MDNLNLAIPSNLIKLMREGDMSDAAIAKTLCLALEELELAELADTPGDAATRLCIESKKKGIM